jgi:hypothetical protein
MKKTLRLAAAVAAISAAGSANALTFQTVANSPFTEYFYVSPAETNSLALLVSGLAGQFESLSFSIQSEALAVNATVRGSSFLASFNDVTNTSFSLAGGIPYLLRVYGVTRSNPPGGNGVVSITTLNGNISPVPEPASLSMLFAGLGLMGAVVTRRGRRSS